MSVSPIDVRRLIADLPLEEHAARADASHADVTPDHWSFRKPFAPLAKVGPNLTRLGAMLEAAELFPGLRVLEFGCGVAWLGRRLAEAGCEVVATDISPTALEAAAAHDARYWPELATRLRYVPYDGIRLDLPDGSFDRILCHEAFHHVPDQGGVLADFARLLAPTGRAVFMEPGPQHSGAESSQHEMHRHGVIENDIRIQDIWAAAQECGFARIEVGLFSIRPLMLPLGRFMELYGHEMEGLAAPTPPPSATYRDLALPVLQGFRMFVLHRGQEASDRPSSLRREGLAAQIGVRLLQTGADGLRLVLRLENTGEVDWLPSGSEKGCVNLGLLLLRPDGSLANRNWKRHRFLTAPLPPGGVAEVDLTVTLPPEAELSIDLVAEHVRWFGEPGLGHRLTLPPG
ncbi:class I SAM-dependent methyltransferase [Falsiroseomonas sp. E2-1-a20]|uniref:class I SAM-dependent methyltransferase n=1 Tax=Falsiroseomonas sp. E2-1-a20 TaxID=3239300 RepID=UPI003F341DE4